MEGYLSFSIEQLMVAGFLETRAALYIDILVTYLVLLPVLVGLSIYAAIQEYLKFHQVTQFLFFSLTLISLSFLGYSLHFIQDFDALVQTSSIDSLQATMMMAIHSLIATVMIIYWMFALSFAISDYKRRALPGVYSESHKKTGRRVFLTIILTSLSTAGRCWVLIGA